MSATACQDPAKAKHVGKCCGGSRVWGEGNTTEYVDINRNSFAVYCCGACRLPLPLPPPANVETSPKTFCNSDFDRCRCRIRLYSCIMGQCTRPISLQALVYKLVEHLTLTVCCVHIVLHIRSISHHASW